VISQAHLIRAPLDLTVSRGLTQLLEQHFAQSDITVLVKRPILSPPLQASTPVIMELFFTSIAYQARSSLSGGLMAVTSVQPAINAKQRVHPCLLSVQLATTDLSSRV
jgi:hypothetical protein